MAPFAGSIGAPAVLTFLVEEIPEGGLEWSQEMPPEWVDPLLGPQFRRDGHPIVLEVSITRRGRNVVVQGRLTGSLAYVCSRCAGDATREVDHAFSHVFVSRSHHPAFPDDLDAPGEAEFTFYDGHEVRVEPVVAEEFVLSMPWFPVCSESCRGLCPHCGQNLNEGTCSCEADVVDPRWAPLLNLKRTR